MPGMYASSRVSVYMVNLVEDLAFMAPGKSWPKMSRLLINVLFKPV